MSDFGKRGRCLHVSAVITSQGSIYISKFQVDNFVLLLTVAHRIVSQLILPII